MARKLKLLSKEDVRMAILRRGNEIAKQMTDEEIFKSPEFASYATHLADFILRKHKLYSLDIQYTTDSSAPIAYTDGKKIVLNTGNTLAAYPKLLERRFKTNMGILFHECAHKLFLDFAVKHKALAQIERGQLFGKFITNGDPVLEQAKKELEAVTASAYAGAVAQIYAHLCNIIDDGHDELAMKQCFPGYIANCIETAGEVQLETALSLSDAIAKGRDRYSIYCSLILQYAKFGHYKIGESSPETAEYLDFVTTIEPVIDEALRIDSLKNRWNQINLLFLLLWHCLREKFPEDLSSLPQNGAGGTQNPQGSQDNDPAHQSAPDGTGGIQSTGADADNTLSPEDLTQAIIQAMQEIEDANGCAPAPTNCKDRAVDPKQIQNGGINPGADTDSQSLVQQIGQKKAITIVQQELDDLQMEAIRNLNLPLIHKKVPIHIIRHNAPKELQYKIISDEISPYVRNLVQEMQALLREMNEEAIQHHRRFGPIVEATESYRPDNTFFAKKKLPDDLPNMAICILVDLSGSMRGTKLDCAVRTVILLEKFASALRIPIMIAGHDAWDGVTLRIFSDFTSAMAEKDKYSLAGMTDRGGCNRDGLPIRICCELLAQRPEEVKLMAVISDGSPNDDAYSGEEAVKDISDTVNEFRRKGLLIYGAAIDKDRKVIEKIYGRNFLSIQDLVSLPKALVRLIRQQII